MDITPIIVSIIILLSTVITYFIIPYIKTKTNASQWMNIVTWTKAAVQCAEIIYKGSNLGEVKKEYVEKYVIELCKKNGIKIDIETIDVAIENAWKSLELDKK